MGTDARSSALQELIRDLPLPLAVLAVDLHGDVILWKSEMERLFGWSEAEVLGRAIPFFPDGLNGQAAHLVLKADPRKGKVARAETVLQRRDGSLVDVGVLSAPLPDDEGNIVGTVISVRDITDRKFAEEALRASEAKYRELYESAHDVIAILDADGRVVDVNRRALELTGYSRSELVGKTVRQDIAVPDDRLMLEGVLNDAKEGKDSKYEVRFRTKGGSIIHFEGTTTSRRTEDGEFISTVCILRDISDRKHAEAELAVAARELERRAVELEAANTELEAANAGLEVANSELGTAIRELERTNTELAQFADAASHDLSEPLRTVATYVQLLGRRYRGRLGEEADDFIEGTIDAAIRMRSLLDDIQAMAGVGKPVRAMEPVDCEKAARRAVDLMVKVIADSGAIVTLGRLPTVAGHADELTRVFQNLIGNAIKFARRDLAPRIDITSRAGEGEWEIAVADNGIGIEPEYRSKVFDMFTRLHTVQTYAGTGAGLALCRKIVEGHGGRIWVDSTPGEGSTFFFTLPFEPDTGGLSSSI